MFTRAGCVKAAIVLLLIVVIAAGVVYLIAAKKSAPPPPEPPSAYESQVRIGLTGKTCGLPACALNNLIKGRGYEVVLVPIRDENEGAQRLAAGSLDIICGPLDALTLALARHKPGFIVFKVAASNGADAIVARKGINRIEDLSGKKIALVQGSSDYMLLTIFLDKAGKTAQECDLIYADSAAGALKLLVDGRADAAVLYDPYLQEALDRKFKAVASTSGTSLIEDYCMVGKQIKAAHPERVREIVKAWFELLEILEKNPGMGRRLLVKNSGIDADKVNRYIERLKFSNLTENKELTDRELGRKIATFQKFWSLEGEPNAHLPIDIKSSCDLSFINDLNQDEIQSVLIDSIGEPSRTPAPSPAASSTSSPVSPPPLPTATPVEVTPLPSPSSTRELFE
jgi:ABC-type nitrate/sulfonate/bicarbonate transport system substrate-binding protein